MCSNPQTIPNPNYGCQDKGFGFMKDCSSKFITVPCGHCPECIANKQMQLVQRVQMEELENHLFFASITYNNDMMPYVALSNGREIRYADKRDVQSMMKRLRKSNAFGRPFRYLAVSELGSKRGRPHFHILFFLPKYVGDDFNTCLNLQYLLFRTVLDEWKRNVTDVFIKFRCKLVRDWRNPVWKPCCTYVRKVVRGKVRTNYDLHYVNPRTSDGGTADVAFYVLKYMMKPSDREKRLQQALRLNLSDEEYESTWKVVRPSLFYSKHFGLAGDFDDDVWKPSQRILDYVRDSVSKSKKTSVYPEFINPVDGRHFPLSRYYKSRGDCFTVGDALDFYYNDKNGRADNVIIREDYDLNQILTRESELSSKVSDIDLKQDSNDFDELYL